MEPTSPGQLVSGGYFRVLGVAPVLGRAIGPEDDRIPESHPVAMVSYGYWKRRFGAERSAVGRTIALSGRNFTIIGVTPPEFFGVEAGANPDIFIPMLMQPVVTPWRRTACRAIRSISFPGFERSRGFALEPAWLKHRRGSPHWLRSSMWVRTPAARIE